MKAYKRILSTVIAGTFIFSLSLDSLTLAAVTKSKTTSTKAAASAAPTPVISGLKTSYKTGEVGDIKLTSTGTTSMVQYKISLVHDSTKKSFDLTKGYTPKYYYPKSPYQIKFIFKDAGSYTLSVTSKLSGSTSRPSKTVTKKISVAVNELEVENIDNINVSVIKGETYALPLKVQGKMRTGLNKELNITWDKKTVNTNTLGVQTFNGTVNGYSKKVILTLSVVEDKVVSIEPIEVSLNEGDEYSLPEKVSARFNSGTIKDVDVKWDRNEVNTNKSGTYIYEGTVDGFKEKVNLTLKVNAVDLKVNSISAANLKEIVVNFNKKIDIRTIKKNNFRLYNGFNFVTTDIRFLDNHKSVVISYPQSGIFDKEGRYTLVVENVKDLGGSLLSRVTSEVIPEDNEAPYPTSIAVTGPSSFMMEFSEPIKDSGTIFIEPKSIDEMVQVGYSFTGYNSNRIGFTMSSPMTEGTQYNISLRGFKDFSGNESLAKEFQIAYKKNTDSIIPVVEAIDQSYAIVKFNKPVTGLTKEQFYHTTPSQTALGLYTNPDMTNSLSSTAFAERVWVKFYDTVSRGGNPIVDTTQKVVVLDKYDLNEIKDNWGSKFSGANLAINTSLDKTPPEVVEIKANSESSFILEFNENVRLNSSNIELLELDRNRILGVVVSVSGTGNKYVINLGEDLSGRTAVINIKDVEDMAFSPNKMPLYTTNLGFSDMTPPQVEKVIKKYIAGLEQSLYIFFSEPVSDTALNAQNYSIQNPQNYLMTRLTELPSFYNGNTVIKVPLTNEQKLLIDSGYNIFVSNIKDTKANSLAGQVVLNSNISSFDTVNNKPKVIKLEAVDKRTLVVTFNQKLTRVDETVFSLNGAVPASMEIASNKDGNTEVTLKAANGHELAGDLSETTLSITIDANRKIENIFGISAESSTYTKTSTIKIEDKMGPSVRVIGGRQQVFAVSNSSGVVDAVVIEYEDDMDMTKLSALSYSVEGREIGRVYTNTSPAKGVPAAGRFVIIELKTNGILGSTSVKLLVTQLLDVYDMNGNKLSPDGKAMTSFEKSVSVVGN